MTRTTTIASAGLAALLVGVLAAEYDIVVPEIPALPNDISRSLPGIPRPALQGPGPEASVWAADILARPLFSAARRPPQAAASTAAAPNVLPRLTGVLVSTRGKAVIFAGGADGKPVTVGEGGRIGAYVVQSIGAGQVTILGPDGQYVLRPAFAPPGPSGAVAVAAQPSIVDLLRQGAVVPGMAGFTSPPVPSSTQQAPR